MTNERFLQAIWEAVAELMYRTGNDAGHAMARRWHDEGGPDELTVAQARAAFEASVLATADLRLTTVMQPIRPGLRTALVGLSEPVAEAMPDAVTFAERRVELLRWLEAEFPWAELRSEDTYTALRAASWLRNTVDAIRSYGGAAEAAEVLRAQNIEPAQVS